MDNITAARDISSAAPMSILRGIRPLCVPYVPPTDFADETRRRADPTVTALWKRLGLVYLFDQPQTASVSQNHVTVNNFTAQLIFRICTQNHTDRLIERYQPGFVFPENIQRAALEHSIARGAEIRRVFDAIRENSRYTEEVSQIFRLVFEKESGGIPLQTVCRALAVLLGSTGGGAVLTAQQQVIFQRIASVLSEEYPESAAAQEIASVGAAAVFTEAQRKRILEAANVMGYRSQHDAAQRVLSLVDSGRTREEIGKVLLREISRYGLENAASADPLQNAETEAAAQGTVTGGSAASGRVIPADIQEYDIAEILYSAPESADISGEVTSERLLESSMLRRISNAVASGISFGDRGKSVSGSVPGVIPGGPMSENSPTHTVDERTITAQLNRLSGETRAEIFRQIFGGERYINGASAPYAERAAKQQVITAATAVRIIDRLSAEKSGSSAAQSGADGAQSEITRQTVNILNRYSAGVSGATGSAAPEYAFYNSETVLPAEPVIREQPGEVHATTAQPAEVTGNVRESRAGTVLPAEPVIREQPGEVHVTTAQPAEVTGNVRESRAGTVLPAEPVIREQPGEVHITTAHQTEVNEIVRESLAGTVLPAEPVIREQPGEVHVTTAQPAEATEIVRESRAGTVLPAKPVIREQPGEVHVTKAQQTEVTENVRESRAGTVLPAEPVISEQPGEVHVTTAQPAEATEIVRESRAGTVLPAEPVIREQPGEVHVTMAQQTEVNGNVRESRAGTVLPAEPGTVTPTRMHVSPDVPDRKDPGRGSFRNKLDSKTLEVIDQLVDSARRGAVPEKPARPVEPQELAYTESARDIPAKVSDSEVIRSVSILRKSIVSESSLHIRRLIEKAGNAPTSESAASVKPFRFRAVDGAENMVMLIPPAEMDRFRASQPYGRTMPPIELKEPPQPQGSAKSGAVRSTVVNNKPVVVKSTESAVDSLSREEISKLADKVYDRIETRLSRERRRMGL